MPQVKKSIKVKQARIKIVGDSMLPLLSDKDWVIVAVNEKTIRKIGNIVLIRQQDGSLLHRLVGRSGNLFYSKGDNRRHLDPPAKAEEIIGVLKEVENKNQIYHFIFPIINHLLIVLGRIHFIFLILIRKRIERLENGQ